MNWDELESVVRAQAEEKPDRELALGEKVAWMTRDNGKASDISAVHCHYENGHTFCRLAIPPTKQHLPLLPSLQVCRRCQAMGSRALHHARLAGMKAPELKASA